MSQVEARSSCRPLEEAFPGLTPLLLSGVGVTMGVRIHDNPPCDWPNVKGHSTVFVEAESDDQRVVLDLC